MRKGKRILALALAGILAVGSAVPGISTQAATARSVTMENGVSLKAADFGDTTFDGKSCYTITDAGDIAQFKNNIKNANSLEISITFTVSSSATNYISLLEIYDKDHNSSSVTDANSDQSTIAVIVSKNGQVFFEAGSYKTGTHWVVNTNQSIMSGSHTLKLTVNADGITAQIDSGAVGTSNATGARKTKEFMTAFFGGEAEGFTDWRDSIDSIAIGGLSADSFFTAATYSNLNGTISDVSICGKTTVPQGGDAITNMFNTELDNTWLFGGGVETQGRFAEVGGVRNYVGQFEEYVRWVVGNNDHGKQRYTLNVGKAGEDAVRFNQNLDSYIEALDPKAVSYMIGPEDYNQGDAGIEAFEEALTGIINKALAVKDGKGYAVIQLPHAVKDAEKQANAESYANAAQTVYTNWDAEQRERIVLVDHFSQTKSNSAFLDTMLTADGLMNEKGHYEIAEQLTLAVYKATAGFPTIEEGWVLKEGPEVYRQDMPKVTGRQDSLKVEMPENAEGNEWEYRVTAGGVTVTGKAEGRIFVIRDLLPEADYELTVLTADGKTQYGKVYGKVSAGNIGGDKVLTPQQQVIRDKAEQEEPLTWLFAGDSITHAAAHTHGYDGIAQLFDKYVKEDLGRTDDIVINTAASGATTGITLNNIDQRIKKYHADIVSVMLGTNDTRGFDETTYKQNLRNIVAAAKEANEDAVVIFRTPCASAWGVGPYAGWMKEVAAEEAYEDVICIDQYTDWTAELNTYSYLWGRMYYFGDYPTRVHPSVEGHALMNRQFIEECGLNTNTRIANLSYQFAYTKEEKSGDLNCTVDTNTIGIQKSALQTIYGSGELGDVTITATDKVSGRSYTLESADADLTLNHIPAGEYTVKAEALVKGGTAKKAVFTFTDAENVKVEDDAATAAKKAALASETEALGGKLTALAGLKETDYTAESWAALRKAVENAEIMLREAEDAEDLKQAGEALEQAKKNLKTLAQHQQEQNKAVLEQSIAAVDAIAKAGGSAYTADSWAKFQKAYEAAKNAPANATAAELKALNDALTAARAALVQKPAPEVPKEGDILKDTSGKFTYRVTGSVTVEVKALGAKYAKAKKIVIPAVVSLSGNRYKVTGIGANAVKGNKKITSVTVGKNVTTIGKNAFANCKNLKSVVIKSAKLKKVTKNAFKGIHKKAVIKVPKKQLKKYTQLFKKAKVAKTVKIKK